MLACTIAKHCYISLRRMPPFLGSKYRVFWAKGEAVDRRDEIQHPGVRGCLEYLGIYDGIEVNHAGDLPARSGLGSSSAFTVGMLNALHVLQGEHLPKGELASEAIDVEQKVLQETVGIQDQITCSWGGLNVIEFDQSGSYGVHPVLLDHDTRGKVERHLVLLFTGLQRHASEIAATQVDNVDRRETELGKLVEMVTNAAEVLKDGDMQTFGALLDEAWGLKRTLSDKVSSMAIDLIYDKCREAGAYGGKLLGAGGGGFMLLCVPPQKCQEVIDASGCIPVKFQFDGLGTQIVLAE